MPSIFRKSTEDNELDAFRQSVLGKQGTLKQEEFDVLMQGLDSVGTTNEPQTIQEVSSDMDNVMQMFSKADNLSDYDKEILLQNLIQQPQQQQQEFVAGYDDEAFVGGEEDDINIGGSLKTFGEGLTHLPKQIGSSIIQALQGQDGASVVDKDWGDRFVDSARKDSDAFVRKTHSKYKNQTLFPGIKISDIAELPQNMSFSATGALAGLATGVGLAIATGPEPTSKIAAISAGSAASGVAAYRMASYQVMQEYLNVKNEESIKNKGREINLQEERKLKEDFSALASEHGLWEAIPEAIGNAAGFGIVSKPFTKMGLGKIGAEVAKRIASLYGVEAITEATTQMGQHNINVEAKLTEAKKRKFDNLEDWAESMKEVLPQVILLSTVMGGGGSLIRLGYDQMPAQKKKQAIRNMLEQAKNAEERPEKSNEEDAMDLITKGYTEEEVAEKLSMEEQLEQIEETGAGEVLVAKEEAPTAEEDVLYPERQELLEKGLTTDEVNEVFELDKKETDGTITTQELIRLQELEEKANPQQKIKDDYAEELSNFRPDDKGIKRALKLYKDDIANELDIKPSEAEQFIRDTISPPVVEKTVQEEAPTIQEAPIVEPTEQKKEINTIQEWHDELFKTEEAPSTEVTETIPNITPESVSEPVESRVEEVKKAFAEKIEKKIEQKKEDSQDVKDLKTFLNKKIELQTLVAEEQETLDALELKGEEVTESMRTRLKIREKNLQTFLQEENWNDNLVGHLESRRVTPREFTKSITELEKKGFEQKEDETKLPPNAGQFPLAINGNPVPTFTAVGKKVYDSIVKPTYLKFRNAMFKLYGGFKKVWNAIKGELKNVYNAFAGTIGREITAVKQKLQGKLTTTSTKKGKIEDITSIGGFIIPEAVGIKLQEKGMDVKKVKGVTGDIRAEIDTSKSKFTLPEKAKKIKTKKDNAVLKKLGEVLKLDSLYEAYPELKDKYVVFELLDKSTKAAAKFTGKKLNEIKINTYYIKENDRNGQNWKEQLLHEVQHAIQHIEGYETGTSEKQLAKLIKKARPDLSEKEVNQLAEDHYYYSMGEVEARAVATKYNTGELKFDTADPVELKKEYPKKEFKKATSKEKSKPKPQKKVEPKKQEETVRIGRISPSELNKIITNPKSRTQPIIKTELTSLFAMAKEVFLDSYNLYKNQYKLDQKVLPKSERTKPMKEGDYFKEEIKKIADKLGMNRKSLQVKTAQNIFKNYTRNEVAQIMLELQKGMKGLDLNYNKYKNKDSRHKFLEDIATILDPKKPMDFIKKRIKKLKKRGLIKHKGKDTYNQMSNEDYANLAAILSYEYRAAYPANAIDHWASNILHDKSFATQAMVMRYVVGNESTESLAGYDSKLIEAFQVSLDAWKKLSTEGVITQIQEDKGLFQKFLMLPMARSLTQTPTKLGAKSQEAMDFMMGNVRATNAVAARTKMLKTQDLGKRMRKLAKAKGIQVSPPLRKNKYTAEFIKYAKELSNLTEGLTMKEVSEALGIEEVSNDRYLEYNKNILSSKLRTGEITQLEYDFVNFAKQEFKAMIEEENVWRVFNGRKPIATNEQYVTRIIRADVLTKIMDEKGMQAKELLERIGWAFTEFLSDDVMLKVHTMRHPAIPLELLTEDMLARIDLSKNTAEDSQGLKMVDIELSLKNPTASEKMLRDLLFDRNIFDLLSRRIQMSQDYIAKAKQMSIVSPFIKYVKGLQAGEFSGDTTSLSNFTALTKDLEKFRDEIIKKQQANIDRDVETFAGKHIAKLINVMRPLNFFGKDSQFSNQTPLKTLANFFSTANYTGLLKYRHDSGIRNLFQSLLVMPLTGAMNFGRGMQAFRQWKKLSGITEEIKEIKKQLKKNPNNTNLNTALQKAKSKLDKLGGEKVGNAFLQLSEFFQLRKTIVGLEETEAIGSKRNMWTDPFSAADQGNVGRAVMAGYYSFLEGAGVDHKVIEQMVSEGTSITKALKSKGIDISKVIRESEKIAELSQFGYDPLTMSDWFRTDTGRVLMGLQSWAVNFFFTYAPEVMSRSFSGRSVVMDNNYVDSKALKYAIGKWAVLYGVASLARGLSGHYWDEPIDYTDTFIPDTPFWSYKNQQINVSPAAAVVLSMPTMLYTLYNEVDKSGSNKLTALGKSKVLGNTWRSIYTLAGGAAGIPVATAKKAARLMLDALSGKLRAVDLRAFLIEINKNTNIYQKRYGR